VIPFTQIKGYNAAVVNALSDVAAKGTFSRSAEMAAKSSGNFLISTVGLTHSVDSKYLSGGRSRPPELNSLAFKFNSSVALDNGHSLARRAGSFLVEGAHGKRSYGTHGQSTKQGRSRVG
jgi:hypothetical protein